MKIAIIGSGYIGKTLGTKWAQAGHQVIYGVRDPADSKHAGLNATSIQEALLQAEAVLLAVPGAAVKEFAAQFGASLAGKLVIDATNNPGSSVMNNLEVLKEYAPQADLIRAFSTLGGENFANPHLGGVQIDLFYCGNVSSRAITDQLISDIGLRPIYLGDLGAVDLVDCMTRLWFALAFGQGKGRRIAFKLLEE